MSCMAAAAKGRIEDKPRADLLYQVKDAFQLWDLRFIPEFNPIFGQRHTQMLRHIHKIALDEGLSKKRRVENHLTDEELLLFWMKIATSDGLAGIDD